MTASWTVNLNICSIFGHVNILFHCGMSWAGQISVRFFFSSENTLKFVGTGIKPDYIIFWTDSEAYNKIIAMVCSETREIKKKYGHHSSSHHKAQVNHDSVLIPDDTLNKPICVSLICTSPEMCVAFCATCGFISNVYALHDPSVQLSNTFPQIFILQLCLQEIQS